MGTFVTATIVTVFLKCAEVFKSYYILNDQELKLPVDIKNHTLTV